MNKTFISLLILSLAALVACNKSRPLTAEDLRRLRLVDEVVPEPLGGAHRDPAATVQAMGDAVAAALKALVLLDVATLKARRRDKFLEMGRETIG